MKVIHKFLIVIFLIFGQVLIYSQVPIPLYKMVMNSDAVLIVESKDYQYVSDQKSEFYIENSIKLGGDLNILKNRYNTNFKNLKVKIETNNNDFYQNINGEECSGISNIIEKEKKYYNIFFLKRKEKKYFVIAHLWNNILADDLPFFEKNIGEINLISKEKNAIKKHKSIKEWFESSNKTHPNQYIIETPFTEELKSFFEKTKLNSSNY
ncbi:hypothetical protein [Chryseobacterium salviniae]|uniref:DUF4412 domain-containing protein n=1 Tax=Chryseobacterium salviniae TaxID=3101750 RepID=A0ABU6HMC1_9FLAO|nr:hypothetical protein [Chryseobacterium sp. T9W2-O]MEC3874206.1 hypothetical protein [Chryseobacterium sp. T9W2-O]